MKAEFFADVVFENRLTVKLQAQETLHAEVKRELARLMGLGRHLWIEVGGARARGTMEAGRDDGQRVSAVQYVRFPLAIDHPRYIHRQELPEAVRKSPAQDLIVEAG